VRRRWGCVILLVMEFLMKTEVSKKLFTVDEWSQDLAGGKPC